jgi:hypothetical protein
MGKTYRRNNDDSYKKFNRSGSNKWKRDQKKYHEKRPKIKEEPKEIYEKEDSNPVINPD